MTKKKVEPGITAYKGFDKDFTCNPTGEKPFKYTVGETYASGKVEICAQGFHSCEMPLDVFNCYKPAIGRFAVVGPAAR